MFKTITFEVVGDQKIVCEGCEQRIEGLLKRMQGIGKARAHARNQRIDVLLDTAVLTPSAIAEGLSNAGYETRVVGSASKSE